MATITVQMGHCFRVPIPGKSVRTGGRGEQKFAKEVADRLGPLLEQRGHTVRVITADERVKGKADVFVALHTDGTSDTGVRGASTGFPDAEGQRLAAAWKRAHQRAGYAGGFLSDNRTANLRKYYGFRDHDQHRFRFLAEHGMHSNDDDFEFLHSNFGACADAHVAAVSEILGDPVAPISQPSPEFAANNLTPTARAVDAVELQDGSVITFAADGGVFVEGDQKKHFQGSMGGRPLNAPVIGGAMADDEVGYWLVGADGGIFAFGAPPIQPYVPLQREHRQGIRQIVGVRRSGPGLLLVSNLGERYFLAPGMAGRRGPR
jgi:hypothetical protein